jgi:hypothetical protein
LLFARTHTYLHIHMIYLYATPYVSWHNRARLHPISGVAMIGSCMSTI